MLGPRRRSTGQHLPKKKKKVVFSKNQLIHIVGGVHKGKTGRIVRTTPKFAIIRIGERAIIEVHSRKNPDSLGQVQIFRGKFLRVGRENINPHSTQNPKHARRRKQVDLISKKMSKLQLLRTELIELRKTSKYKGKRLSHATVIKISGTLEQKINRLQSELKKKGRPKPSKSEFF